MLIMKRIVSTVCFLALALSFSSAPARAGQYSQDFSPYPTGTTSLGDGSALLSNLLGPAASVQDATYKELQLTTNGDSGVRSALLLPDLDPGTPVYAFSVKWNADVNGNFPNVGEGFSFNFGQLSSLDLAGTGYLQEAGFGTGLSFGVQTYFGNNPGFYLRINGTNAASVAYNASTQWGTNNPARHFFEVDWNYTNGLSVRMDGTNIFTNVATTNFTPHAGDCMVWAARCGTFSEEVRLDNIIVMTGGNLIQIPTSSPYYKSGEYTNANQTADKAFDGNIATKWLTLANTGYIGATVSPAATVAAYALTSGEDVPGRDPQTWTVDGSNNGGTNWTSCASGSGYFFSRNETRAGLATIPASFGAYRLNISANNGDPYIQLAELQFYQFIPVYFPTNPVAATAPASQVYTAGAILNGQVTPSSTPTTAWFQWGLTTNYGNVTANQNAGNGGTAVTLNAAITGLSSKTIYHCQLVASNSFGTAFGGDVAFTTALPGQYYQDFSAFTTGATNFGDGSQLFSTAIGTANGAEVLDDTHTELGLTEFGGANETSAFELPDLDPGTPVYAFSAKWNSQVYGNFPSAGDGFSFNFGQFASLSLTNGNVESGYSTGLCFSAQTSFNPGFYLRLNGNIIASSTNNPMTQWGTYNGVRHLFEVDWNHASGISVKVDGTMIFTNVVATNYMPQAGSRFVWAARCDALSEEMRLDNIILRTGGNLAQVPATSPYYWDSGILLNGAFAFDNNSATEWLANEDTGNIPWYIGATVSSTNPLAAYVLISGNDRGMPATWAFQGSTDSGVNWTTLASTAFQFINHNEARGYPLAATNALSAYRILIAHPANPTTESTLAVDDLKFYTFNVPTFPPIAVTAPASQVHLVDAILNGQVTPYALGTIVWFQWGLTTNYGNVTAIQNAGDGNIAAPVAATITGLSSGTTYHCQLVASNSFGTAFGGDAAFTTLPITLPWTMASASGSQWTGIACSADGTKLAAITYGYGIYLSTDTGTTWTNSSAFDYDWNGIASSADGTKLAAVSQHNGIYTSTDSGATWTASSAPTTNTWHSITSSADGRKLAAVVDSGGGIYTSTDSGTSWTVTSAINNYWESIASSSDGTKLVAVAFGDGIYTSTNSGTSWTMTSAIINNWGSIASSSDGTKLAAVAFNDGIYTSTNSGTTWKLSGAPLDAWLSIASSADGSKLLAGTLSDGLYTSLDSGATWQPAVGVPGQLWVGVASSADGNTLAAVSGLEGVFTWLRPSLGLAHQAGNLTISWTTNQTGLIVQQTTNLASPNWTTATNAVILTNGQYQILISPTVGNKFFRLGGQ